MITVPSMKALHSIKSNERLLLDFPRPARGALPLFVGYASPYRIGMSNLGFHFLFGRLRQSPSFSVERFFLDTSPRTLETGSKISSAPVILFSLSYEEDYINLVRILHQSGIPPLRGERNLRPVVIAGGPAVSANPLPLAGIVDLFVLGEGERPLGVIADVLEGDYAPQVALERMAGTPGIYVPGLSGSAAVFAPPADAEDFPASVAVTTGAVFPDAMLVESGRGCPGACAFCMASALYGPYRPMPLGTLKSRIMSVKIPPPRTGLVSTAVAAHPGFAGIIEFLRGRGFRIALSSIRAEDLDDEKAALIGSVGIKSVSLAPESGSESLRRALGKRVPNEVYFHFAAGLRRGGVRNINLYLLVGLPGETHRSMMETKRFLEDFKKALGGKRFSVHCNVVVPKAWTPLQFFAMPEEKKLAGRLESVKRICGDLGLTVKAKSARSAIRQAILSLGDERVGAAITAYAAGGVSWKKALSGAGVDVRFPHEVRGIESSLPWDVFEGPVDRGFLLRRYLSITGD